MIYKLLLLELLHHRIALADALKEMPMTAEALAKEMPKIAQRLRHEAGIRVGDSPRSYAGVMKLFEKIPSTSKLETSEAKLVNSWQTNMVAMLFLVRREERMQRITFFGG